MHFSNDCAFLNFHKQSLKGRVQDYVISFHNETADFTSILTKTSELFQRLCEAYVERSISARLVAKVNFYHINTVTGDREERDYHFPSLTSERVIVPDEFFHRHSQKIVSRMDNFVSNGSNLLIKNIEHIHIQLSFI